MTTGDLISREAVLDKFADYVGGGMSMNDFDALDENTFTRLFDNGLLPDDRDYLSMENAIRNGTPLDDITTVIRNKYDSIPWRNTDNDDGWIEALEWSLDVIENILSKAESEDT